MANQFLNRVGKDFGGKAGLALSAGSLGLGVANYRDNLARESAIQKQKELEQKSLKALQGIHQVLKEGAPVAKTN
jgi:hypothetical protein